jgi:hypothetical protein
MCCRSSASSTTEYEMDGGRAESAHHTASPHDELTAARSLATVAVNRLLDARYVSSTCDCAVTQSPPVSAPGAGQGLFGNVLWKLSMIP